MKFNLVDSCGWLEYFVGGPNEAFFQSPLSNPQFLIVPTICIAEVFKILLRESGRETAATYVAHMGQARVVDLDRSLAVQAAAIGIRYQLSIADSIILASARLYHARLWTQDKHFETFDDVSYIKKS